MVNIDPMFYAITILNVLFFLNTRVYFFLKLFTVCPESNVCISLLLDFLPEDGTTYMETEDASQ